MQTGLYGLQSSGWRMQGEAASGQGIVFWRIRSAALTHAHQSHGTGRGHRRRRTFENITRYVIYFVRDINACVTIFILTVQHTTRLQSELLRKRSATSSSSWPSSTKPVVIIATKRFASVIIIVPVHLKRFLHLRFSAQRSATRAPILARSGGCYTAA